MATTTNKALRYPSGTVGVAPDVAGDIHNLATDIDTLLSGAKDLGNGPNMNGVSLPGTYTGFNWTNAPDSSGFTFLLTVLNATADGNNVAQIAQRMAADTLWWHRTRYSGTWGPWVQGLNWESPAGFGSGTTAAGFTPSRFNIIRYGRIVTVDFSAFRAGGTITGTTSGNIVNVVVGNIGTWKPQNMWAPLAAGPGGPTCSFAIERATGNVVLAAMPPSYNLTNGQELTCGGSFITDN